MVWAWTNSDLSLVVLPRSCVGSVIAHPTWYSGRGPHALSNVATMPVIADVIYTYLLPMDQQQAQLAPRHANVALANVPAYVWGYWTRQRYRAATKIDQPNKVDLPNLRRSWHDPFRDDAKLVRTRPRQPHNIIHLGKAPHATDCCNLMLRPSVVAAVLFAALLHAAWNVAVRAGHDRRRETALMVAGGAVLAGVVLPFLPLPPISTWRYLLTSAALNAVYFALIAEAYARGGVALAYPLMRGVAPMLAAFAAWGLIGEALAPATWIGIATICAGVVALARPRGGPGEAAAMRLALANAAVIAAYTLNDAIGARLSGAPLTYALWLFPLTAVPTLLWLHRHGPPRLPTRTEALRGLSGASCMIGAYAVVLWAMTRAPVAPVAALRETAILFGVVLARLMLGERPGRWGWGGALTIAAGAAILRLA